MSQYGTTTLSIDGNRATWRLAAAINADKINLTLPGTITDGAGNPLGSPYSFRFDVLAGDTNADGAVNVADVADGMTHQFTTTSNVEFSPRHDINGNGRINFADTIALRNRFGTTLPAGNPGGSPVAPAAVVVRAVTAVRSEATDAALDGIDSQPRGKRAVRRGATSIDQSGGNAAATVAAPSNGARSTTLRARRARVAVSSTAHDAALSEF